MAEEEHGASAVAGAPAGSSAGSEEAPAAPVGERFGYGAVGAEESVAANRAWWDAASAGYLDEHGATLGVDRLVWGPEGLDEEDAGLLGGPAALRGVRALEVGCGAGQGARWARSRGARAVGVDLSLGMLHRSRALDAARAGGGGPVPVLQADARALPLADAWADVAFSAYGALPFVADAGAVLAEVARVLRPGGRWVFSTTHPLRWAFPDVPGVEGLTASRSYFDRTPYAERSASGELAYAEHHRTLGDWVAALGAAGLVLEALVEPEWPPPGPDGGEQPTWGGWSPLRGAVLPGTVVFACRRS